MGAVDPGYEELAIQYMVDGSDGTGLEKMLQITEDF